MYFPLENPTVGLGAEADSNSVLTAGVGSWEEPLDPAAPRGPAVGRTTPASALSCTTTAGTLWVSGLHPEILQLLRGLLEASLVPDSPASYQGTSVAETCYCHFRTLNYYSTTQWSNTVILESGLRAESGERGSVSLTLGAAAPREVSEHSEEPRAPTARKCASGPRSRR